MLSLAISEVKILPWQVLCFYAALLIYAVAGAPTPDGLGIAEYIIGILLLISAKIPNLGRRPAAESLLFVYGLTVPILNGCLRGHDVTVMVRDIIPFIFLLLPLLYQTTLATQRKSLIFMMTCIGFAFAVRALMPYLHLLRNPAAWVGRPPMDLLYLANSPEVLFSALILLGHGGVCIWRRKAIFQGSLLAIASGVPALAMSVMMQRAGLGSVALASFIWGLIGLWLKPSRMILIVGLCLLASLPFSYLIISVIESLIAKTEAVGLNSRTQEWQKVFELLAQSPMSILFGLGWGATFENPAVGNLPVNYTHSLISSLWLKTGLAGVVLCGFYIFTLIKGAVTDLSGRPVLALAIAAPLGIGILFYASYKCLGFGLLLLLLALSKKLEQPRYDVP